MTRKKRAKWIATLVIVAFVILWILPVLWLLEAAVDGNAGIFLKSPEEVTLNNFRAVVDNQGNQRAFANSLFVSFGEAILVIICSTMAGYVLSRYKSQSSRSYMYTILFMTTLPGTVLIVPVYKMFLLLKMYDNLLGVTLFLSATSLPTSIWMMTNFCDSIPIELEEAAAVDGAGTLARLYHIIAPLILPGICVVGIRSFSGAWGNFMTPYILLSTGSNYTASIMMYKYMDAYTVSYGSLAAFSVIYSLPSIVLYIFSQKIMARGFLLSGANKG